MAAEVLVDGMWRRLTLLEEVALQRGAWRTVATMMSEHVPVSLIGAMHALHPSNAATHRRDVNGTSR